MEPNLRLVHQPVEIRYSEGPITMSFHSHIHFEIYYFHGGKGNYLIGDKIFVLAPGDLILMHGMTLHCPNVDPNVPYRRTTIHFDPAFVKTFAELPLAVNVLQPFYELKNHRVRLSGAEKEEVEGLLRRMTELYDRNDKLSYNRMLVVFLDLLLLVYGFCQQRTEAAASFPSDKERHVQNIVDYLENHFHEDLHLDRLEERFHLNKYYLSKIFKEVTGTTIFTYLYHRRINQAKIHFLLDRDLSVTEVCYRVGFKHPSHFTRMFKAQIGCTPEQYRKRAAPV